MANTCATERAESAEAKPHGRVVDFPAASYRTPRKQRGDLRRQFERLLIFVLCALWGLGITLWALAAVANWATGHGAASANAATGVLMDLNASLGVHLPITLARYLIGW
jgi:hypothetical protein